MLEWEDPWLWNPDVARHRNLYQQIKPDAILTPLSDLSKFYTAFSWDVLTQKVIEKFFNLWWQFYLTKNTWESWSNIANWSDWRFSIVNVGIGESNNEWKIYFEQMTEILQMYNILGEDKEFEIRFRHEISHDIWERYLHKLDPKILEIVLDFYQKIEWTLSPMASNRFYKDRGRRVQFWEDIAEMMALYLKDPSVCDQYLSQMLKSAIEAGDENTQSFILCFHDMIKEAYFQYMQYSYSV